MNKLTQKLLNEDFRNTGEHKYVQTKFSVNELRTSCDTQCVYDLRVSLGARVVLSYGESQKGGSATETKRRLTRFILEEVFGEFRKDLMDAQYALYNQDTETAMQILTKIERDMFEV